MTTKCPWRASSTCLARDANVAGGFLSRGSRDPSRSSSHSQGAFAMAGVGGGPGPHLGGGWRVGSRSRQRDARERDAIHTLRLPQRSVGRVSRGRWSKLRTAEAERVVWVTSWSGDSIGGRRTFLQMRGAVSASGAMELRRRCSPRCSAPRATGGPGRPGLTVRRGSPDWAGRRRRLAGTSAKLRSPLALGP